MRWIIPIVFTFALLLAPQTFAATPSDVVINEIAWMGTTESYNNEWVEFYNSTQNEISLDGWILRATDGTPIINLLGAIPGNGYFLLERTDDNTVPSQTAHQIYTGALGNSGEHLELVDNQGAIVDDVNSWGNWFAGDNTSKQTMERKNSKLAGSDVASWKTANTIGGTPKAQNGANEPLQQPQQSTLDQNSLTTAPEQNQNSSTTTASDDIVSVDSSTSTANASTTLSFQKQADVPSADTTAQLEKVIYPENIFINEMMPSPFGSDEVEEWIEIFNGNDEAADISLWKIRDTAGAINTYEFPKNSTVSNRSYLVLSRPTTQITLSNEGDGLELIMPDGKVLEKVNFSKALRGKSYARKENTAWLWSDVPTPGSANIIADYKNNVSDTPQIAQVKKQAVKIIKPFDHKPAAITTTTTIATTTTIDLPSQQTASLASANTAQTRSFLTAVISLLIAFFSGLFIFVLKRKLR